MIKIYVLLLIILGLPDSLFAQNLVNNPSFECGTDICGPTQNVIYFGEYSCDWSCPSLGTSDIFSTLVADKSCYSAMPYIGDTDYRYMGYQLPRTGNRFAGIYTYNPRPDYREYLQVKLGAILIPGDYYCYEMYVSSSDFSNLACNNLGIYFSEDWILDGGNENNLPFTPQVIERNIINDTVNWVRISGTFKATTPARYLIIGNFSSNDDTDIVIKNSNPGQVYDHAYYFIDDVSLEHLPQQNFAFASSKEICIGEQTTLEVTGFQDISWTTLEDTLTVLSTNEFLYVKPLVTTQYRVTVKNCNLIVKDTVTVTVVTAQKVDLGKDTTICAGSSIRLNAVAITGAEYKWQDKSTSQYLDVNKAGKYSVSVSNPNNICKGYDEINIGIETIPEIELGNDTIVCEDFFPLKAGGGNTFYQWSTGSSDSIFTPPVSGKYSVMVRNQCGQSSDSIRVYSFADIFIPNVLTLNGDKLNEEFKAIFEDTSQKPAITVPVKGRLGIYNRWGDNVFYDSEYTGGWPSENNDLEGGVYYLTFSYGKCPIYKGWIQILK